MTTNFFCTVHFNSQSAIALRSIELVFYARRSATGYGQSGQQFYLSFLFTLWLIKIYLWLFEMSHKMSVWKKEYFINMYMHIHYTYLKIICKHGKSVQINVAFWNHSIQGNFNVIYDEFRLNFGVLKGVFCPNFFILLITILFNKRKLHDHTLYQLMDHNKCCLSYSPKVFKYKLSCP